MSLAPNASFIKQLADAIYHGESTRALDERVTLTEAVVVNGNFTYNPGTTLRIRRPVKA